MEASEVGCFLSLFFVMGLLMSMRQPNTNAGLPCLSGKRALSIGAFSRHASNYTDTHLPAENFFAPEEALLVIDIA